MELHYWTQKDREKDKVGTCSVICLLNFSIFLNGMFFMVLRFEQKIIPNPRTVYSYIKLIKVKKYIYAVNPACNDTQVTLKIALLHPDIVITE